MVFKKKNKKEVKEETINESEIIDMPGEEVEEGTEELPEIESVEPKQKKKTATELQLEILELKKQIVTEEKEIEDMEEVEEEAEEQIEESAQQVQVPQQPRVIFMNDTDLIRQTFSDVQSLRVEIQNLRYIIEKEIAK